MKFFTACFPWKAPHKNFCPTGVSESRPELRGKIRWRCHGWRCSHAKVSLSLFPSKEGGRERERGKRGREGSKTREKEKRDLKRRKLKTGNSVSNCALDRGVSFSLFFCWFLSKVCFSVLAVSFVRRIKGRLMWVWFDSGSKNGLDRIVFKSGTDRCVPVYASSHEEASFNQPTTTA
jgi:hypothetical protein